jgi:hypothetical protein
MTTSPPYNGPASLLDRFENLKRDGWLPSQAVEILSLMHLGGHFHTPFGPLALGFRLGPDGRLIIDSDAGELDPGKIPTRDPGFLDPKPVPFTMPTFDLATAERERAELLKAAMVDATTLLNTLGTLRSITLKHGSKRPTIFWSETRTAPLSFSAELI